MNDVWGHMIFMESVANIVPQNASTDFGLCVYKIHKSVKSRVLM